MRTSEKQLDDEQRPLMSNDLEGAGELCHSMVTLLFSACYLQVLRVGSTQKEGHLMTTLLQDKPTTAHDTRSTAAENTATIKQWVASMVKGDLDKAPYAEDAETSDP